MKAKILKLVIGFKQTFLHRNFILFCLLGIVNTFNTALFSHLLHYIIQDNISAILGYILSLQGAFLLTCKFIFCSSPTFKKYRRFLISYLPSFIMYVLIHAGILNAFNISQFWATFIAVALSGPLTYIFIKIYAFGKSESKEKNAENNY